MALIDDHLDKLRRRNGARVHEIDAYMCKPCFKNCGLICNGNKARDITDKLGEADNWKYVQSWDQMVFDYNGGWMDDDGYLRVYTDGSAIDI